MRLFYLSLICALLIFTESINARPATDDENEDYDAVDDEPQDDENDNIYDDKGDLGDLEEDSNLSDDDKKNLDGNSRPIILTKGQEFTATYGDVVTLPCKISDEDDNEVISIWKKGETLLFQGNVAFGNSPYINRTADGSLKLINVTAREAGEYSCLITVTDDYMPKITHKVTVLVPPTIVSIHTANNRTEYSAGEKLQLTCNAIGNPPPKVQWYKDKKENTIKTGDTLVLENLTHKDSGSYRCLADNHIIRPAHGSIEIKIDHKPIVTIHKHHVNSDHDQDVQLKCIVKGFPTPQVNWQKDGTNIVNHYPHIQILKNDTERNEHIHILQFKKLEKSDFGVYTCAASNRLGSVQKNVNLVRTPAVVQYVEPEKYNGDVSVMWKVESHLPIFEHEIYFRKQGEEEWQTVKPEVQRSDGKIWEVKYTIKGLDPEVYETKVRSQNAEGWSEFSDIKSFNNDFASKHYSQHKHHKKPQKVKEPPVTQTTFVQEIETPPQNQEHDMQDSSSVRASQTAGSSSIASSVTVICIALLTIYNYRL